MFTKSMKSAVKFSVKQLANTKPKTNSQLSWKLLELKLKIQLHRVPLMSSVILVLLGYFYYSLVEPDQSFRNILLIALAVRVPKTNSDISGFYQLCLPIFLEVIFFGFLLSALVDRYDPVAMGRIISEKQSNHTVVIGYTHLGQRIVKHLRDINKPFCVVEQNKEAVEELLAANEPVVVGDALDMTTLQCASIDKCKEVFVLVDSLQHSFIVSFHLRGLSHKCNLYIELSNHDEFKDYFTEDPFKAFTFSISRFAVESLNEWTQPEPNTTSHHALILGSDSCAREFVKFFLSKRPTFNIYVADEGIDERFLSLDDDSSFSLNRQEVPEVPDLSKRFLQVRRQSYTSTSLFTFTEDSKKDQKSGSANIIINAPSVSALQPSSPRTNRREIGANLTLINCYTSRIRHLSEHIDFKVITYIFICWSEESKLSDAIYLSMAIQKRFPHIKLFVRTHDDQLREVLESFGATVFSTSSYAFNMLRKVVPKESGLFQN